MKFCSRVQGQWNCWQGCKNQCQFWGTEWVTHHRTTSQTSNLPAEIYVFCKYIIIFKPPLVLFSLPLRLMQWSLFFTFGWLVQKLNQLTLIWLVSSCWNRGMSILKSASLLVWLAYFVSSSTHRIEVISTGQSEFHKKTRTKLNRRQVLTALLKLEIEASRGLCQQIGMWKCGQYCCDYLQQPDYASSQTKPSIQNTNHVDNQAKLCASIGLQLCGTRCCPSQACARLTNNSSYFNELCIQAQPSSKQAQSHCRNSGLLWCDGKCCGFDSSKHKCYKINHYGVPYIRCPIEDPVNRF